MAPGDRLLLGTDLVKDRARLVAAYDDAAGVTAEFNRNVLHVLNRELGADFDPEPLRARGAAGTRPTSGSRCGCARSTTSGSASADLDLDVAFAAGEELLTEISAKFTPDALGRARGGGLPRRLLGDRGYDLALTREPPDPRALDRPTIERHDGASRRRPWRGHHSSVATTRTSSSDTRACARGRARPATARGGRRRPPRAAWYYPEPKDTAKEITDRVAFWKGVTVEEV